jgi:Yip1 domain
MSNRQIQPVRNRDIQIIRQARPRSLWGQVWNVALQPNNFFLALPQAPSSSRQWFWVALLILALNGFSAVRQEALSTGGSGGGGDSAPLTQDNSGDFGGKPGAGFSISPGGGGISAQPGGFPGDSGVDPSTNVPPPDGAPSDITSTWVTALISATTILVGWFVLAVILCEVPLFNGVRPSFSQNLQIAIWTTVPLGIMAGLQVIYWAAGGKVGAGGISGLLTVWKGYNDLSPLVRSILLSLTSRLTVFWVWTLVLIYVGGRKALNGKSWAVGLVVVVWVLILVLVPVVTGAISAPIVSSDLPEPIVLPSDNLPSDNGILPEATQSEGDLSATVEPSGSNNSAIPTAEGSGDSSVTNGDTGVPTRPPKG